MSTPVYYTAAEVRKLDQLAIEKHHIPGFELMQRAGKVAFNVLLQKWPGVSKLIVCCGTGNNGGDGFILASLAKRAEKHVEVYLAGSPDKIHGDARTAYELAYSDKINSFPASEFPLLHKANSGSRVTVIIDALLGTGLSGDVREHYSRIIDRINNSGLPVLALDIPSGLCSDTGKVSGSAIKADVSISFIGRKVGSTLNQGPEFCGELFFDDLQVPESIYSEFNSGT